MSDEVVLIGLMAEEEFEARFILKELHKIFFDTLQFSTMLGPLLQVLRNQGINVDADDAVIKYSEIRTALKTHEFLSTTPRVRLLI